MRSRADQDGRGSTKKLERANLGNVSTTLLPVHLSVRGLKLVVL